MRRGACAAAFVVLALPTSASADAIPPGHEGEISAAVTRAAERVPDSVVSAIAIDRDVVRVEVTRGASTFELVVGAPTCATCPVEVSGAAPGDALGTALAAELTPLAPTLWTVPADAPEIAIAAAPLSGRAWLDRGLFALVLAWAVAVSLAAARSRPIGRREPLLVGTGLLAFLLVASFVPARGTLHEHASFVARNDCAWTLECETSAGWAPPFFHVYGPILRLLPHYDEASIEGLGLLLSTLALGLVYGATRQVLAPYLGLERARRAAAVTALLIATSPVFLRLAVSDTPWPFVVCLLAGAALAATRERPDAVAAASALLGFAALSSHAMLGVLVLAAPLATVARRHGLLGIAAALGPVTSIAAPDVLGILASEPATALLSGAHLPQLVALDPRFAPLPLLFLAPLGALEAVRRRMRPMAVVAAALGVTWLPIALASQLGVPHPTRLLFSMPEIVLVAPVAALGLDWVMAEVLRRHGARLHALAWVTAALAHGLGLALATEGLAFLGERDTLARELAAIESMLAELPATELLIVPDPIQPTAADLSIRSDDLEVVFPIERARAALTDADGRAPRVELASRFLAEPEPDGALVYSGVSWRSFLVGEIADGRVPDSLEREQLVALRRMGDLVPVVERVIDIHDHPDRTMRVLCDREPAITVGFYRLTPR